MYPDSKGVELKFLVNDLLSSLGQYKGDLPYFLSHMKQVISNSCNKGTQANRWDKNVIALAKTIRYLSGKSITELVNGKKGDTNDNTPDISKVTLGLPSVQTIVNRSRPLDMEPGWNETSKKIVEGISKKHDGKNIKGFF